MEERTEKRTEERKEEGREENVGSRDYSARQRSEMMSKLRRKDLLEPPQAQEARTGCASVKA